MSNHGEGPVDQILRLFAERGGSAYGHEAVSQREHALQTARFARESGARASLVAAALLHDIGHLLHDMPDETPAMGLDDRHEALGERWLGHWFGADVVEPVRLHVDAKRYLCGVEPAYHERLSPPSRVSLALQGGPMSEAEVARFRESPHFQDAIALRRWDDTAKVPGLDVPGIDAYIAILEEALRAEPSRKDERR